LLFNNYLKERVILVVINKNDIKINNLYLNRLRKNLELRVNLD